MRFIKLDRRHVRLAFPMFSLNRRKDILIQGHPVHRTHGGLPIILVQEPFQLFIIGVSKLINNILFHTRWIYHKMLRLARCVLRRLGKLVLILIGSDTCVFGHTGFLATSAACFKSFLIFEAS